MKALYKDGTTITVCSRPEPRLTADSVRLQIVMAGLCRTDLYVARGQLPSLDALILGHECSGTVLEVGAEVEGLHSGQAVGVFPWLGCGHCQCCLAGRVTACAERKMLGVHRDGAFAEQMVVPACLVHPLPKGLSYQAGAYLEPVAASLAVLQADLPKDQRGLIYGHNRIAELTYRIMRYAGFTHIETLGPEPMPDSCFDFVVETQASPPDLREVLRLLRPGGHLVLKSRYPGALEFDSLTLLAKELRLSAVNYGDFREGIRILAEEAIVVNDLLGPIHPLEDWPLLFEEADHNECSKRFFGIAEGYAPFLS